MDGLEDQAEAALSGLLQQLHVQATVEIGHSSRDALLFRICEEIKSMTIAAKALVFRGGISLNGLRMLQQALKENETINELQFVSLKCPEEVQGAIECCRSQPRIQSLSLKSYTTGRRADREGIAATICSALFWSPGTFGLKTLEIASYPIGARGAQILTEAVASDTHLTTFRLVDCDLRSDSASSIANMIKMNKHLLELDLSYNPHFLGSEITRELTFKTLVQRGLRFNTTLLNLKLEQFGCGPVKRAALDRQLKISKFRAAFEESRMCPFDLPVDLWAHVLARVALKPSVLYLFLQEGAIVLFR